MFDCIQETVFGEKRSRIADGSYYNSFLYGMANDRHNFIRFLFVKPTKTSN